MLFNKLQKADRAFYDFAPSAVASMERPPARLARMITWTILVFCIIALSWLTYSRVDIVVSAQGKLVPSGKIKVVQTPDEGVVRTIYIRDGQEVQKGDPLMELDRTSTEANEVQLGLKLAQVQLSVQRLRIELGENIVLGDGIRSSSEVLATERNLLESNQDAFIEEQKQLAHTFKQTEAALSASKAEVAKLGKSVQHLRSKLSKTQNQADLGLIPKSQVTDIRFELQSAREDLNVARERASEQEAKAAAAEEKYEGADVVRRSELLKELSEKEQELRTVQQDLIKAEERTRHHTILAPVSGVVQQLAVNTEGGVVTKAQELMVIIPKDSKLELAAKILNKDIGFINSDQPVDVKVDAFEYTRYGSLNGDIEWVGSDAILDEEKGQVYPARIKLSETTLPNKVGGRIARVLPGMSATVDIVIGQRRLIEYFLGPMLRYKDESLNER